MTAREFKPAGKSQTSPSENTLRKEIRQKPGPARIAQIVFLDGKNSAEQGNVKQYVNLPRSDEFVDGTTVPNIARLGANPLLEVRFNRRGNFEFTVECKPIDGNADFSPGELSRNPRFGYQKEKKAYKTDDNGCFILPIEDFYVSAAGKNKYIFRASDANGVTVSTGILETHRLIYYIELKMRSLISCATDLSAVEREYAKYNIQLVKLPGVEMEYMPNVGFDEILEFTKQAKISYNQSTAPEKHPYVIAIAYTDHLAEKRSNERMAAFSVPVGPGNPPALVKITTPNSTTQLPEERYLWQGIVPGEGWFVSARFIRDGDPTAKPIQIPADKCTAMLDDTPSEQDANIVRVDVSHLAAGVGTIELRVNFVSSMRAGLASFEDNLIRISTRTWWSAVDAAKQTHILIHELGHKMGLVADGQGKAPDKVSTFYEIGHFGRHCYFGIPPTQSSYDSDEDYEKSKCVMYGVLNSHASFCINCGPAARKVDLSDGWEAF